MICKKKVNRIYENIEEVEKASAISKHFFKTPARKLNP